MSQRILVSMLLGFGALGLAACEKPGPAEQAGERIDDAINEARDRAEDVREEAEEAADEIRDAVQGN